MYKPSMFNYSFINDDKLILYNSFKGTESIIEVDSSKVKIVQEWLTRESIDIDNEDFRKLCEYGFFVQEDVNEKNLKNLMYAQRMCEPILDLTILTTKECNFRCKYCYLDFEHIFISPDVQTGIVKFIQKNISKYTMVRLSWFGGEPLLGIDAIVNISKKVQEICKRAKKQFYASITTNGYLLTPTNIEKLVKCDVTSYVITLDGIEETHNKTRVLKSGGPTYDTIIKNLLYIKNNIINSDIRVIIRNNFTSKMIPILNDIYNFYNEKFGDDRRFSLFVKPVSDTGKDAIQPIKDSLLSNDEMNNIMYMFTKIVKKDGIKFQSNYSDLEPGGFTCPATTLGKYSIGPSGIVSKCDDADDSLKIGFIDKNGNIIRCGTREEDWVTTCFEKNSECENCFFSACCFHGTCPIDNINKCRNKCTAKLDEVKNLILLYIKSNKIDRI